MVLLAHAGYVSPVQPFAIHALPSDGWPHWLVGWAALLALSLMLARVSHRWIERAATLWLRNRFDVRGGAAVRPLFAGAASAGPAP